MDTMAPILAAHPFCKGLDSRYLKLILECASRETFTPGQLLCQDNQEARKFYVIHHGRVAVEIYRARRGAVTIQTIGEGEVLGWLWFDQPYHWHLDARALDLTRVISLEVQCLLDRCAQDHGFGYEIMRRYAHRLAVQFRATKAQLADFYGD
ncbi:MAG: cyclic nucleotide-binding domain-containing protein [Deltaproteobacteria bacterium]|nr:cyclic nucleotide-binding domain-containing protein [Deltaproteobacteria bacterium]